MPQPIPNNLESLVITIGDVPRRRQELSLVASEVLAAWPQAEHALTSLGIAMIHGDPAPTAAVLGAIRNNNAQRDAFNALAAVVFHDERDRDLLKAVLKQHTTAAKARNVLAHHLWATHEELEDSIIFVDPSEVTRLLLFLRGLGQRQANQQQRDQFNEILRTSGRAWKQVDFRSAFEAVRDVIRHLEAFKALVPGARAADQADRIREELSAVPAIAETLGRIAQRRQN